MTWCDWIWHWHKPRRIAGTLTLASGDVLPVTAFRCGFIHDPRDGRLTRYVVAYEDGSPLTLATEVVSFQMDLLPGRSAVEFRMPPDTTGSIKVL